jgi:TetR/AcrR family transcriptional regulator, transcriptional repressor for nem operon
VFKRALRKIAHMQWTATGLTRPKPSMPPSRKHHNRIRDLVLQSAGRLFNRHGFNAVSIDDVMAEAGLTRGSFYCYFASKSDLYAQSVARVIHEDRENPKGSGSERTRADKIVRDYLSEADQNSTADTFPMIGLPNDVSRTDQAVRQAFESAVKLMIQSFEQAANGNAETRRSNALAIAALCVGGMVLSRSIDDLKLGDELRSAAKATALNLGKW